MSNKPLKIQLTWDEPTSGERRSPMLMLPIALGRDFVQMPDRLDNQRVSRIVLNSGQVSRFHALITAEENGFAIADRNSRNGLLVNGQSQQRCFLASGDVIQIGPYQLTVTLLAASLPMSSPGMASTQIPSILFQLDTDSFEVALEQRLETPSQPVGQTPMPISDFLSDFSQAQQLSVRELASAGLSIQEVDYATIGAGLGSFIWADLLRICGVQAAQIMAIGIDPKPYSRYRQLCLNSQIPLHERLRSNSDSCPDNIWGFPSYAWREAWHDLGQGKLGNALKYLWQVFAEPILAETYTPCASNVFDSLDREAQRIDWEQIFAYGRVRLIRKTQDGRYAIAFSRSDANHREHGVVIARYVHLAIGYPAIQFLPDLQAYRQQTKDFRAVVNAYENHDHVYEQLAQKGGTVLLRGRGIVASRVIQRLYEVRQQNPNVMILHLMRSPKSQGNRYELAQRRAKHHQEFQPFNWPKACWGGELRAILEKADPQERQRLLTDWGGTTTADRADWQRILQQGLDQGWYQITFGDVEQVEPVVDPGGDRATLTYVRKKNMEGQLVLKADFIIDATGLDAKVQVNPLLSDLVEHYNLPLNLLGRLSVSNDFELPELRNQRGRVYATGAVTLGGPYAAVDSFLGLQYAALRSVDDLAASRAPAIRKLTALTSAWQWCKWVVNSSP